MRYLEVLTEKQLNKWAKKIDFGDCWEWKSYTHKGYGKTTAGGRSVYVHRAMWVYEHQREVAPGKVLDHLCRNRRCCNPAHLEEVSDRENLLRSPETLASRLVDGTCPRDERGQIASVR